MQRKELKQAAVSAALHVAALVMSTAAAAAAPASGGGPVRNGNSNSQKRGNKLGPGGSADLRLRLLPAAHVLLLWLAHNRDLLK